MIVTLLIILMAVIGLTVGALEIYTVARPALVQLYYGMKRRRLDAINKARSSRILSQEQGGY